MSISLNAFGRCAVAALVALAPAVLGAGPVDQPPHKVGPARAEAARGWDGKVQGMRIVTPVELRFEDPRDLEAFAAGRLPIGVTLRSAASGQTVRFEPAQVREGHRAGDGGPLLLWVVIDRLLAPVWDEGGCTETRTDAGNGADGTGIEVSLTYAACGSTGPTPRQRAFNPIPGIGIIIKTRPQGMVAGNPIGNVIVKGGKNPGGNLMVTPRPSDIGRGAGPEPPAGQNIVILSSSKGTGSPEAAGF